VDDGSTDSTARDIAPLPVRDERIVLHRQANRGLARSRNTGMRLSDGEYMCFLDSDDEYLPAHIASRVAMLERMKATDMVYGGLTVRGPVRKRYVVDLEAPNRKIHVKDCFVGGTFFMRRTIYAVGYRFRPLEFGEDLDLFRRVQKRFRVRRVEGMRTYVYHCETSDRMCDAFTAKKMREKA